MYILDSIIIKPLPAFLNQSPNTMLYTRYALFFIKSFQEMGWQLNSSGFTITEAPKSQPPSHSIAINLSSLNLI